MKKKSLIIVILIVVVAMLAGLGACTTIQNNIKIKDNVVSRFGDGIKVLDTNSAPKTATEYKDTSRVTAKVNVDARMSGFHITGLYLPAGESLTITVPNTEIHKSYSVYVTTYSTEKRESKTITNSITELTSSTGGIVEILVPKSDDSRSNASFDMKIEGGIVIPYYRLGRDSLEQIQKGNGKYAVLDCVNTRFYVPTSILYDNKVCRIDDLYNVLLWWQSAVSFINETLGIESNSRDYTSSIVLGDYSEIEYDSGNGVTCVPVSYFEKTLYYSCLVEGEAWDLLYKICEYKAVVAGVELYGVISRDSLVNILSAIDHVVMTNPSDPSLDDTNWLHNSYTCLDHTIELLKLPSSELLGEHYNDLLMAFFINILHSFGLDKTIEIISKYREEQMDLDEDGLALLMSEVLLADMSLYFDTFQMKISPDTKSKMSGNNLYVPVQTLFTVGSDNNNYSLGYSVAMGDKVAFDFENNIISLEDGWKVDKLVGSNKQLWSEDKEVSGLYYYTPSQDRLIDDFYVTLTNGTYTVTLYGKINVIITVATYKVYEGWNFDNPSTALVEAINSYGKRSPNYVGSIDFAGVLKREEVDNSVYILTVTSGCIRVPESGMYRFYLRNSGRCRVEFGVPKYMFNMFDISIPFSEFTRGHSYDISLEADRNYYFNIYLLSTKGSCDAALGIRYIQGKNVDDSQESVIKADVIDSRYLIYNGLAQDKIVTFEPPVIYPTGYGLKEEFYQNYNLTEKNVVSYPEALDASSEIEYVFDVLNSSYYTAAERKNEYEFILDLNSEKRLEYVRFFVRNSSPMIGADVKLTLSNKSNFSGAKEITFEDNKIVGGLNTFIFNAVNYRYLKIKFYAENNFECSFTDFELGQHFDESQIVPNTSSSIAYMGGWLDIGEYVCVNGSVSQSVNQNSLMSFTAISRQICIYGVKDSRYGKMDVYVDGSKVATVNLHSETTMTDQLLFAMDFDLWAEHTVKVMPASDNDIINVDYISYIAIEKEEIREYSGFLYAVFVLPAIIIIALVGAWIADRVEKNKRQSKKLGTNQTNESE